MHIEIPENATNGEVIKILFPQMLPRVDRWNCMYYVFSQEWFNTQYRMSICKSCIYHGFDANGYAICNSPNQAHHEGSGICPDYAD